MKNKRSFPLKDKLAYYQSRQRDSSLTPAQREYAQNFVIGAEMALENPASSGEYKDWIKEDRALGRPMSGWWQGALSVVEERDRGNPKKQSPFTR